MAVQMGNKPVAVVFFLCKFSECSLFSIDRIKAVSRLQQQSLPGRTSAVDLNWIVEWGICEISAQIFQIMKLFISIVTGVTVTFEHIQ